MLQQIMYTVPSMNSEQIQIIMIFISNKAIHLHQILFKKHRV